MRATGWACIARMGGCGDNLIAASTLRPLKRLGYKTEVITSSHQHAVFLNNPFLDKLTVKEDGDIPGGAEWQKWFAMRSKEYDIFAHLSHTCEMRHALFTDQCAFWWRQEYRRELCAGSYLETVHKIVGVPFEFGPMFFPTEDERTRAQRTRDEQIGGPYLAWVLSGSRIDKVYPYAAMAMARVIRETGLAVVMMGIGDKQFEMAKATQAHVARQNGTDKGLHLAMSPANADPGGAQDWPVRRVLTQAVMADVVVTPDTGVAWAVSMEPMPKIVLHSHASVENIVKHWINTVSLHADPSRVPCWPCHRLHNDPSTCVPNKDGGHAAACISDISVETILAEVEKVMPPQSSWGHSLQTASFQADVK
jgi:ADP-heptose:LPS heptosyltransferase